MIYPARLIRLTFGKTRNELSRVHTEKLNATSSGEEIERQQLERFNQAWSYALTLPFYSHWKSIHDLPTSINQLSDLAEWPALTKDELRGNSELVQATPGITGHYRTSGSSGEPFNFPKGSRDSFESFSTLWSYRIGHGLQVFDPYLGVVSTIGGTTNSRFSQWKERAIRTGKDVLANSWKTKGFIATPPDADSAIRALRTLRPKYIIGYTSGIAAIARRVEQRKIELPYLSHVILTSETIEAKDIEQIRKSLNVNVLVEYGASELGVIAGTPPGGKDWPISVLWWSSLVRTGQNNAALITTLGSRQFPLINYAVGDILSPHLVTPQGSVLAISEIEGRARDFLEVATRDGKSHTVSARQLIYLVRDQEDIHSVQVVQREDAVVELLVVAPGADQNKVAREMAASIAHHRGDFAMGSILMRFVNAHIPGARGKKGMVVDPSSIPTSSESISLITS